jgi:hypothetical protein
LNAPRIRQKKPDGGGSAGPNGSSADFGIASKMQAGNVDPAAEAGRKAGYRCRRAKGRIEGRASTGDARERAPERPVGWKRIELAKSFVFSRRPAVSVCRVANRAWCCLLPLVEVHLRTFALRLAGQLLDPGLEAVLWAELGHGDGCLRSARTAVWPTGWGVAVVAYRWHRLRCLSWRPRLRSGSRTASRCKSWSPIRLSCHVHFRGYGIRA